MDGSQQFQCLLICKVFNKSFSSYHMCENSSSPLRACSGLLNTLGSTITTPLAFAITDGCLGTPRLFWNVVSMTPICLYMITSSDVEEDGWSLLWLVRVVAVSIYI